MLRGELSVVVGFADDLSLFSKEYIAELQDRTHLAERRAEQVRKERERKKKEQEAANKPFDLASFIQKNITLVIITIAVISLGGTAIKTYGGRK